MSPNQRLIAALLAFCTALTAVLTLTPAQADDADRQSVVKAADWIASRWDDGAFGTQAGGIADGLVALSAADLHHDAIDEMLTALAESGPAYVKGPDTLGKVLIAAIAGGAEDPAHLFGPERDLEAELLAMLADRKPLGAFGPYLALTALLRLDATIPDASLTYLLDGMKQSAGGGFGFSASFPDADFTGVAVSALNLLATTTTDDALRADVQGRLGRAIAWAEDPANQRVLDGNSYWNSFSPANTAGLLGGALAEAGRDVSSVRAFMRDRQAATVSQAAWSNTLTGTSDNLMATVQGILVMAGRSYALAQRTSDVAPQPTVTVTVTTTVTAEPTTTPTVTVTAEPTTTPTVTVTAEPTTTPTVTVTAEPTTTPTVTQTVTVTASPTAAPDIYVTEGRWSINGREWRTSCERYSTSVERCRTEIWATTIRRVADRFVSSEGWTFNNLTYFGAPRSQWAGNPLGNHNSPTGWTAADGRRWRTECDTELTGRGGCRSFVFATTYGNVAGPGEPVRLGQRIGWVFNNIVRFNG